MTDERAFWLQIRRGLAIISAAISAEKGSDPFWAMFLRGVNICVRAIEQRWKLPHSSIRPIGQPNTNESPSLATLTPNTHEGNGATDGL